MPGSRAISPEEAQLSLDFIVGFTIFMIAFIFVATMMSGLLINLQSRTIDYDAVAYRTSVVLVEDPGEVDDWHLLDLTIPAQRDRMERLGLSIARNNPEIVLESKLKKFFDPDTSGCGGDKLCYPSDYTQKLIFGDYPYHFNISYRNLDGSSPYPSVGEMPPGLGGISPGSYGYIRRVVDVKKPGYIILNAINTTPANQNINIHMLMQDFLYLPPVYRIDPVRENITIILQNFTIPGTKLTGKALYEYPGPTSVTIPPDSDPPTIRVVNPDGSAYSSGNDIQNGSRIIIDEGYFTREGLNELSEVELRLAFTKNVSDGTSVDFVKNAKVPPLTPGVLEVWIW
jgi:hypothetical protein